jgi:hypothetical protein
MGLEARRNGTYYYRKIRVGGKVRSEYVCGGIAAQLFADLDEEQRVEAREAAAAEKAAWQARRAELDAEERGLVGYARAVERVITEALEAAGWHRQGRRFRWARARARGRDVGKAKLDPCVPGDTPDKTWTWDTQIPWNNLTPEAQACSELARKAQDGSKAALLEYLKQSSDETRETLGNGNLGGVAKIVLAGKYSRGNPLIKHAVLAKMRLLRAELAGDSPSRIEWYLADVAAQSWADFQRCAIERECLKDGSSIACRGYYDRRVERAHRRFIRSIKALAAVRRVPNLTAVQVNLGNAMVERFLNGRPETSIEVKGQDQ